MECAQYQAATADLEATNITVELMRRPARRPDYLAERAAMASLAERMHGGWDAVLRHLAEVAAELCRADAAGVGLLEIRGHGTAFRWQALSGAYAAHLGATTPHRLGPQDAFVKRQALLAHPARSFAYLQELSPPAVEALLTPLPIGGGATGTIWVLAANSDRKFDAEDARVMNALAHYVAGMLEIDTACRTEHERFERREVLLAAEVRRLAMELTQTEQAERKRLARVLHDGLQQTLVAARIQLSLARRQKPDDARRTMRLVEGLIGESITATRSLTVGMSPPMLESQGLAAALQWLAQRMLERDGLTVKVEVAESGELRSEGVRDFVFQAVRELLFNCVKHAGVDRAWVRVSQASNKLRVTVEDRGNGFDPVAMRAAANSDGGFGLLSVSRRVALLGGQMDIDSAPGEGARVTLVVPVEAEEAARVEAMTTSNSPATPFSVGSRVIGSLQPEAGGAGSLGGPGESGKPRHRVPVGRVPAELEKRQGPGLR